MKPLKFTRISFESEYGDPVLQKREASYLLETHFNPLVSESERFCRRINSRA